MSQGACRCRQASREPSHGAQTAPSSRLGGSRTVHPPAAPVPILCLPLLLISLHDLLNVSGVMWSPLCAGLPHVPGAESQGYLAPHPTALLPWPPGRQRPGPAHGQSVGQPVGGSRERPRSAFAAGQPPAFPPRSPSGGAAVLCPLPPADLGKNSSAQGLVLQWGDRPGRG